MAKRFISVVLSMAGIVLSVIATFYEAIDWYAFCKYQDGGTAYTQDQLLREFMDDMNSPLVATFAFAVAAFILYSVMAQVNINKFSKITVAKVIGAVAFFASIALLFKYDIPGEGLEIFIFGPVYLIAAAGQFVLFIVMLAKNKKDTVGVLPIIFFTIGILCSASIAKVCEEPSVYVTTLLMAISLVNTIMWYWGDEAQKTHWRAIPVSVICILLAGAIAFVGTAGYVDSKTRIKEERHGVVYVGSNEGNEKERAHFIIDGFEGYYAQKEGANSYYPYSGGAYCLVEAYDFSSENIVIPATLDGKTVVFKEHMTEPVEFFKYLSENRDKFKTITFADELDYTVEGDMIYSKSRSSKIVFCLNSEKDIVITDEVIGEYAFAHTDIENVAFKNDGQLVAEGAFADCPMKEVVFPDNMNTTGEESVFGSAPKLQKVTLGKKCHIYAPLGDFDKEVRRKNDEENITLSVDTRTPTDLYDLGTMIYNYPAVELNIHMSKQEYTYASTACGVSVKMMEKIQDDGSTFAFTDTHYESGEAYSTKITISFTDKELIDQAAFLQQ